jgi:ribosomal protein L24
MNESDDVQIKSGNLKGCKGVLVEIVKDDDMAAYRVRLTDVSGPAHQRGYRLGDMVDMDRHELEVVHAVV